MGIFTKQAHKYANYRPRYPGKMYQEILNYVGNRDCAWDCGTGSGQVAVELSKHFETVFATDISEGQLANAYRAENVQYLCTPAEKVPFQDNMFDLITVAQAIHWFDFNPFYSEVRRTIKNQGIIAMACYLRLTISGDANEIFSDFYDEMFTQYFDINRRYVDEKYTTLCQYHSKLGQSYHSN